MKQIILDLSQPEQTVEITENSELIGLFVGRDSEKLSSLLKVVHKKPELQSLTSIKAVVYDDAYFDMEGMLVIETGARNTDAYLRIDVLLMSEQAGARAVPSLEITEDNVKGGHGATVGQIDREQLFYLTSRGLPRSQAETLLVEGFVQELLDRIEDETVREQFAQVVGATASRTSTED
ncbi:MAG: FeS cluster assembly protein SufD [candidate division WS6 bacterium OLB20]|uniref:FeS cluster assembly protein SufD n=1 Tax=candidate division WS6 bacterium OLB20 TaxID=1617426 RepID=A0A136LWV7_9BACT|nr:MAG: FeS cluster assembly protein SufD [candidate division WS6 bacterium OLB20]